MINGIDIDAAAGSTFGIDRHPGRAERFHIAINRSLRDLEAIRQDARRTLPARLEQQQERDEPIRLHGSIKLDKYDTRCQVSDECV